MPAPGTGGQEFLVGSKGAGYDWQIEPARSGALLRDRRRSKTGLHSDLRRSNRRNPWLFQGFQIHAPNIVRMLFECDSDKHWLCVKTMARDLQCNPETLAGPIDDRVVANIQRRYPLDGAFLDQMATCHGGVPQLATFDIDCEQWQIGQFLTLLDDDSKLSPPERPHFDQPDTDERVVNGIPYLMDYEHSTSRALFTDLVPFAALDRGMCLDRAYVNLLCFDYRNAPTTPTVKMWLAHNANDAYMDWDELPFDQQFDAEDNFLSVPWDTFLTPVSDCFGDFIQSLR